MKKIGYEVGNIQVTGPIHKDYEQILTPEAIGFIAELARKFEPRRQELLQERKIRQHEIDSGKFPDFLPETKDIRESDWTVALISNDLLDRKVEITGPVERKMIINALNCGAKVFMADFEDSNSPSWKNNIEGQINLRDAINRTITFETSEKKYELKDKTATLMVRPRGWHLNEEHVLVDGKPISAALFDFGLFLFHNAKKLIANGTGPYFYLPKLESHKEVRLWNDVFNFSQNELGIKKGTIKATVLIETILAAFEMDEILYELKDHSAGLNAGRWDYLFSIIKKFSNHQKFLLPDRAEATMDQPYMKAYTDLLIKTCHKRNVHAMGGMAAQIPIKSDPKANEKALEKVRQDKLREVTAGHDGTWVAHPALVPVALEIFENHIKGNNQINKKREDVKVTAKDLLTITSGKITEAGLRTNISVGIQYLDSWLKGNGCVALYNLMEDAATAEISRSQIWQWIKHKAIMVDGRKVTIDLVKNIIQEELGKIKIASLAGEIFEKIINKREFTEFLTLEAYPYVLN